MRKLEIQEKNQIRKLIKSYFLVSKHPPHSLSQTRKLFTLPRPTDR